MGVFENMLAELNREKQDSIDTQHFRYGFQVWVPYNGVHKNAGLAANQGGVLPWPGAIEPPNYPGDTEVYGTSNPTGLRAYPLHKGVATLKFKNEEDADFSIEQITLSAFGPINWKPGTRFELQNAARNSAIAAPPTYWPMPGVMKLPDPAGVLPLAPLTFSPVDVTPGVGGTIHLSGPMYVSGTSFFFQTNPALAGVDTLPTYVDPATGLTVSFQENRPYYAILQAFGSDLIQVALSAQDAQNGAALEIVGFGANPSTNAFNVFPFPSYEHSGVMVRVRDTAKVDKWLTSDGFTPIENLFPPAFGAHIAQPWIFEPGYVLEKQHTLQLDFLSREVLLPDGVQPDMADQDQYPDPFTVLHVAFHGVKIYDR